MTEFGNIISSENPYFFLLLLFKKNLNKGLEASVSVRNAITPQKVIPCKCSYTNTQLV